MAKYLDHLNSNKECLSVHEKLTEEPKSFGVFLGAFDSPPTAAQRALLSKWDVIVLNPLQEGVMNVLETRQSSSTHVVGRVDIQALADNSATSSSEGVVQILSALAETLRTQFRSQTPTAFTGILLANFSAHLQPVVLNKTIGYVNNLGLDVWLEIDTSPAACLTQRECRDIKMDTVRGLVYRNGTIRRDGDYQNYFHMSEMRTAMRAIAAQRSRSFMMMWETLDDGVKAKYAIVQRSFNWTQFNSTLCWIGSESSLIDADVAAEHTVNSKPLGGLMWLKDENVMAAHNYWRANNQVREIYQKWYLLDVYILPCRLTSRPKALN